MNDKTDDKALEDAINNPDTLLLTSFLKAGMINCDKFYAEVNKDNPKQKDTSLLRALLLLLIFNFYKTTEDKEMIVGEFDAIVDTMPEPIKELLSKGQLPADLQTPPPKSKMN